MSGEGAYQACQFVLCCLCDYDAYLAELEAFELPSLLCYHSEYSSPINLIRR